MNNTQTKEVVSERQKCEDDIEYFVNKYVRLMTPEGVKKLSLRDYQIEYLKRLQEKQKEQKKFYKD